VELRAICLEDSEDSRATYRAVDFLDGCLVSVRRLLRHGMVSCLYVTPAQLGDAGQLQL
jgi:hypothetical protein